MTDQEKPKRPRTAPNDGRRNILSGPVGRATFLLALPVLGEQVLNTFVGLFDTYLGGQISPAATAAVGLGAYVGWLASLLAMLIGTGTTAIVSRHAGAQDTAGANRFANQSMSLAALLGVLLCALFYALAPNIATYCNMSGEGYAITVGYLRIDAASHLFGSLTLVGCAALRGMGDMRTPMLIFAVVNTTNIAVSYCLVYGIGPFPTLGVTGVVTGTVTARVVGAGLLAIVLLTGRSGLRIRARLLRIVWAPTWRILRIGLPAAVDGVVMWTAQMFYLAIISRLGQAALGEAYLAAHIVAVRVEALTYLPAVAWGSAAATMIGQSLGAGLPDRAKWAGHMAVAQCGALSIVMAGLFYTGAEFIYAQMSTAPLVRTVGAAPFKILALFQPLLSISIVYIWAMRGAGDTRTPLGITCVGSTIRVVGGWLFGIHFGGGLLGGWFGMIGDMMWRAGIGASRFATGTWAKTKV